MPKRAYMFGLVAAIAIIAATITWLVRTGSALDAESRAYIDEAAVAISSHWSKDELLKRASPQFVRVLDSHSQELDRVFAKATDALGPLKKYEGATGEATLAANAILGGGDDNG